MACYRIDRVCCLLVGYPQAVAISSGLGCVPSSAWCSVAPADHRLRQPESRTSFGWTTVPLLRHYFPSLLQQASRPLVQTCLLEE